MVNFSNTIIEILEIAGRQTNSSEENS